MPSEVFVQGCGVVATVLLVLMLLPQVWQVFRTRRAEELSHVFLGLMNFGLVMLTLYNLFLELWVFFVAGLLQLFLGVVTQVGKVWADRYQRRLRAKAGGGQLARGLSLRSGAKLELAKFASGTEAPFPLLRPAPTHAAQHLLLDARLPAAAAGLAGAGSKGSNKAGGGKADGQAGSEKGYAEFAAVAELLRDALAGAALLQRPRGQLPGGVPATNGGSAGNSSGGSADEQRAAEEHAETALLECHDGYAALVWHAETSSLSVDCLAVTAQSMRGMAAAAEVFCAALAEHYPGSQVTASSLGRLPAPAAE